MGMVTGLSSRAPPNNQSLWETVLVGYDPSAQQVFASRDLCGHSMTDLPAMPENPFCKPHDHFGSGLHSRVTAMIVRTGRTFANLTLAPGEDLSLQLFVDGPLIELVANERAVLSVSVWPALNVSASLGAYGGAAIKALEYHALRSNLRPSDLPSSSAAAVMKADDSESVPSVIRVGLRSQHRSPSSGNFRWVQDTIDAEFVAAETPQSGARCESVAL